MTGSGSLPDVASLVERIHTCRVEELTRYEQLLELSHAQRTAIIQSDTDSLVWATEEKGRLIQMIETLDLRIAGLIDDISMLVGDGSQIHRCRYPELGSGLGCPINARIAHTMKEILEAEGENQALLEDAISVMGNEVKQLDAGGKAVKAYQGRSQGAPAGNLDETF
ncbi:MAG: flagellar export chaperone FlgN [Firmicutes bacterium]|nr:flagellar export chaperone FlgN [Bacillota bacterium]